MKLKDIQTEIVFDDLWVVPDLSNDALPLSIGYITASVIKNEYRLIINKKLWRISLREPSLSIDLDFHLKRGCAHLVEVVQVAKDNSAQLKVVFFSGSIIEMGAIEIAVDEHIEKTAKKSGVKFQSLESLISHLQSRCEIKVGNETFFVMLAGKSADIDFNHSDGENAEPVEEKYRAFSIYGERLRIPIEKRSIAKFDEIFFATKLIAQNNQRREGALKLVRGVIKFSDYSKTGRIRALASGAMSRLTQDSNSYLKQWDEYGAIEGELFLNKAKNIGAIKYQKRLEKTKEGVKFFISTYPKELSVDNQVAITDKLPIYVKNPEITWDEYRQLIEEQSQETKDKKKPDSSKDEDKEEKNIEELGIIPIISISENSIELKLDFIPNNRKYIVWSTKGEQIQIERRMKARSAILEGRSANPLLGLLIEEGGVLPKIQRVTKLAPLTPFVRKKIFGHPPTPKQVEAIEIALNTPDIAIIQGPPGTGKTTVVTAILERLNEEFDKTKSIRGQILVSGFQHDAVENIVSRLSINALPAVKFGKRSSDSEFTEDSITQKLYNWCQEIADNIRINNPEIQETEYQKKLSGLFHSYYSSPSQSNTTSLLKGILDLPRAIAILEQDLFDTTNEILLRQKEESLSTNTDSIRYIRALRISDKGFSDDGVSRAIDLLEVLQNHLNSKDKEILEHASRWKKGEIISFLDDLKELKGRLLLQYIPKPEFRVEKHRSDILKLIANVSEQLKKTTNRKNKKDFILAEFLHELENNPDGVRETIEDYNFVFAATTQQAEGAAIRRAKTKFRDDTFKYDTVIIDEAARTSPRDLLIPMSQAEKRIILVGDHRQLPHLIDEEVARALENDESSENKVNIDFVKTSMFEYLFKRLKNLEKEDGIKRTVTLDAQYRTHPQLGQFASDNFYEQHKERYRSPLEAKYFKQDLSDIQNKAAVWLNVPYSSGKEMYSKDGGKRWRPAEAKSIAQYLRKWINSEEGKKLSFGIISFYKPQVFEVFKQLEKDGFTKKTVDGSWEIHEDYQLFENGEERLRIGTVDSFQGMEFDVVFLSIVRTQDVEKLERDIKTKNDHEKIKRRIFGHLVSENRLCVSMSRQKKALIIVGDANFIQTPIATDAIPALKNYYNMCLDQGVIL